MDIKKKHATDCDDLSSILLKDISNELAFPLTHISKCMFSTGIFPDGAKYAKIIPVPKLEKKIEINNFRPISCLSVFSKVFERLIYNKMENFQNKYSILVTNQFGYRKNKNTTHAMFNAIDFIKKK